MSDETALLATPMTRDDPATEGRRVAVLAGVFAVSGVCGLIYESIWSHYLKLFVGHAAYAQTVVLVVFIGGMALGAAAVGRYAERIRSPLMAYACAEALIGAGRRWSFTRSSSRPPAGPMPRCCPPSASRESPCIAQWALRRPADPAAVDPARHHLPADDHAASCASRRANRAGASRCSTSSTASAPRPACCSPASCSSPRSACPARC